MSFDPDDLDPLPAVDPRTEATRAARDELRDAVADIRRRHSLTFAELFWCLGEVLRWWSESALDAERRGRDT